MTISPSLSCQACGRAVYRAGQRGAFPKWCKPCKEAHRQRTRRYSVMQARQTFKRCQGCDLLFFFSASANDRRMIFCSGDRCRLPRTNSTQMSECTACGEAFILTKINRRFCSESCRMRQYRTTDAYRVVNYQHNHRRRAAKAGATIGPVDLDSVYATSQGKCGVCRKAVKRSEMTLDHIVPLAAGGAHAAWNLQPAHLSCNSRKGHRGHGQPMLPLEVA